MPTPDWFFRKKLKRYDKELDVRWNDRLERFQILRTADWCGNPYSRTFVVMNVALPDGSFRPLDERVLIELQLCDSHNRGLARIREIEQANRRREEALDKEWDNDFRDITRQNMGRFRADADRLGATNIPREDLYAQMGRAGRWRGSAGTAEAPVALRTDAPR